MLKFMIRRRQILLLICVYISVLTFGVAEFESLDDHGGSSNNNGECALLLEGPGRSSAYDYNLNTLRLGNPSYGGAHTCITYDAVNNAYVQARKYIRVVERKERYQNEELATVGELLLEVSRILSRTYGLSVDEIEHGLPLIDTSKTLLREVCPAFLSNVHCQPGKYRRYDGLCNNLKHPTWGAVQSTFARLLKPVYSDAISDPRVGAHGASLPPPRIVSRTIHPDEGYHDHAATILLISWGQFMDHDLTLTATPLDPVTRNEPEECCHRPPEARNPYCIQIDIPHDDPFYGVYGVRCIDFVRGFPGVRAGCRLGSRNQFNILSGIIDGNTVYGVDENFARSLRTGYGGLLRMNPVFAQYGLHDLLPLKLDIPDEGCTRPNKSMYCFDAGEIRVNEQLVLTCMHTLMAREHNRVVAKLGEINPHWDDETLYQEGRRIVVAEIQHITYNEFLPLVLGKEVMAKFGLLLQKEGYWDGYDANVNPSVIASFAAAAFRFGHSLLPTNVERWSKAHKFIASRRLRDLIRQPFDLYRAGVIDEYFMGMSNQVAQAMDDSVTQEVTNHLFRKPNQPFGVDLAAFNMQRGREFGLPSYMEYRKYCGLPDAHGWDDLFGSMNNITVKRYSQIYVHPGDIDLWSGGVSERPLPGAMVGPTFACVIASQFSNTRRGDRFWYELGGHPHSFSLDQLSEIRKARLARIVCDNTDLIDTIQLYPMVLPDHEINPRVPCRSGVLLHVDLTKWADYGGGAFSHQSPVHADALSLGSFENDPSVGKYVNQDGLQQLRHYLKVGPYKSYLSGQSKNAFFGYLRQMLTRRPVTLIHSTKGHDASNIANVHYTPQPEHDDLPAPGVDLSPRGFPRGAGLKSKGGFLGGGGGGGSGPPHKAPEVGPYIPISGPSGPHGALPQAPPPTSHHQYYDFTGTAQQSHLPQQDYGSTGGGNTAPDYMPARPPPPDLALAGGPPPPVLPHHHHQPHEPQPSYGDTAYSFKGPLTIYYGFKPVATPYGNISLEKKEYGSSFRRYDGSTSSHYSSPNAHAPPVVEQLPSLPPPPASEQHQHHYQPQPLDVVAHNNLVPENEVMAVAPPNVGVGVNVDMILEQYDNNRAQYPQQEVHHQQHQQQEQPQQPPNYYSDYNNYNTDSNINKNNGFASNAFTNNIDQNTANGLGHFDNGNNGIDEPSSGILPPTSQTNDQQQPPPFHVSGTSGSSNAYYGDYPDFSTDEHTTNSNNNNNYKTNVPLVPSYSTTNYLTSAADEDDLDRNSYKNAQYRRKRDLMSNDQNHDDDDDNNESIVQRSGAREIQRDLQEKVTDFEYKTKTLSKPKVHQPHHHDHTEKSRSNHQNGNTIINKKSISLEQEQQSGPRYRRTISWDTLNKSDLKIIQGNNNIEGEQQKHPPHHSFKSLSEKRKGIESSSPFPSSSSSSSHIPAGGGSLGKALTSAMGFVVGLTEMGVSALRNFATSVNSFANAINTKLNVGNTTNSSNNTSGDSNVLFLNSSNIISKVNSGNRVTNTSSKAEKVLIPRKDKSLSPGKGKEGGSGGERESSTSDALLLHQFLQSNQFVFSNGSRRKSKSSRKSGENVAEKRSRERENRKVKANNNNVTKDCDELVN